MKVTPYLTFNGECAEALVLYEKAFEAKAETMRYKDAPPSEGYQLQPGTEDYVMHGQFKLGGDDIFVCDTTPDMKCSFAAGVSIHVALDNKDAAQHAFDVLKEGGAVGMELQQTFWSQYFGMVTDKFGVGWMISVECQA